MFLKWVIEIFWNYYVYHLVKREKKLWHFQQYSCFVFYFFYFYFFTSDYWAIFEYLHFQ